MALERTGGVMVYDVTDPDNSEFVNYINSRDFAGIVSGSEAYDKDELDKWVTGGDVAPEGLAFIPAAQSPTGRDLLLAACEVSGTVAVYELTPNQAEEPDQPDQPDQPDDDDDDDDRPSHSGGSSGPDRNTVSVDSGTDHGTVTVNPTRAQEGDTVTVTVRPDDGYELDRLTVTGRDGNELELERLSATRYTFEMPDSRVTVDARFVPVAEEPQEPVSHSFPDVAAGAWYAGAVQYVCANGLMEGTGNGLFQPDAVTSRAMIVTILYRLAGAPQAGSAAFPDVAPGAWYADAVAWASASGIVTGYGSGLFGPNDPITREQLAVMLCRFAQSQGEDTAPGGLQDFADAGDVSAFAREAMGWAVSAGRLTGKDGGRLAPQGSATRAEAAAILMRYCQ